MDPRDARFGQAQWVNGSFEATPSAPTLDPDRLKELDGYGIGGPGARGRRYMMRGALGAGAVAESMAMDAAVPPRPPRRRPPVRWRRCRRTRNATTRARRRRTPAACHPRRAEAPPLRSNFAETAFWSPQLLTGADGSASIEFTVPDSVTSWNVWVHAVTKDLRGGSLKKETKSVKELMVRPYVPRFLREGDRAELKVVVNNASEGELKGSLAFEILDPETNEEPLGPTSASRRTTEPRASPSPAGGGTNLTFFLTAPPRVRTVAFKVTATSGTFSDGELRPLPVLPGRMHLVQSRFVTLREGQDRRSCASRTWRRTTTRRSSTSRWSSRVDAQLFYGSSRRCPTSSTTPTSARSRR